MVSEEVIDLGCETMRTNEEDIIQNVTPKLKKRKFQMQNKIPDNLQNFVASE